ncbi:MAG TPA: hypothetical protein VMH03_22185, partial [Terriglobales bacterium]|nr:hypothetical protein [Terriglobales bacterium]
QKREGPAEKPTASNAEGKALADKVVERMGGLAKLRSVRALRAELTERAVENGPATPFNVTIVFPDRIHVDVETPRGILTLVVTPEQGFMSATGMGARDLPRPEKDENMARAHPHQGLAASASH